MINFKIDTKKCTQCRLCAKECPQLIINAKTEYPEIKEGKEESCIKCQHCLAVCPTGALSIWDLKPENSIPVDGDIPTPENMAKLIKTRRSTRKFKNEELSKELINKLVETAIYAPTSRNNNSVLFSVIDNKEDLGRFRELVYNGIKKANDEGKLPADRMFMVKLQEVWEAKNIDILFRDAPHLIITSAPKTVSAPETDCHIALSYFELMANTHKVGTLWNGFIKWAVDDIAPEIKTQIGIPEDHVVGFVMLFGNPAVKYARSVQIMGEHVNKIRL